MGAVFLAEDQLLKRQVVIKALLSENDPDLIAQSIKEREFLAAIKHASIVSIYDFLAQGQRGSIVMEYVQGKTLDQSLQEQGRPFDVPEAIASIQSILPAFTYLAKLGLVYCDVKPQNMMLEVLKDGSRVVKLIDLGTVIRYEPHPPGCLWHTRLLCARGSQSTLSKDRPVLDLSHAGVPGHGHGPGQSGLWPALSRGLSGLPRVSRVLSFAGKGHPYQPAAALS
jgi:serine/threonine protein kinase